MTSINTPNYPELLKKSSEQIDTVIEKQKVLLSDLKNGTCSDSGLGKLSTARNNVLTLTIHLARKGAVSKGECLAPEISGSDILICDSCAKIDCKANLEIEDLKHLVGQDTWNALLTQLGK